MLSIDERAKKFDFRAWPTKESLPAIYRRCRQLVTSGRSITIVRHYVPEQRGQHIGLEVVSGLRLDERRPIPEQLAGGASAFGFRFTRCESLRISCPGDRDEATAALRFHEGGRDTAQVAIFGIGEGVDDHIELTHRNAHNVVTVTRVQLEDRDAVHPTTIY
ncbi:hypothetical protein ACT17_34350 [Mycolicibacterium conceptionense]|uniref:Uncharacterized protein n=1 Tax=Mycolicibacterium conceptionense TaxID=451644 RepID=A0A0J8TVZ9_9MYCO|nr:hypothetical protein [Mycolicibacterium conceptionense]KMV13636.1 hypothetical protein ACT17_34350 [Mycolicibacterium conceptionense]